MRNHVVRHGGALMVLLGLLGAKSAQADEAPVQGYIMTVYSNMAHGEKILDGSEKRAIARLARKDDLHAGYLEGEINLCVAYAKTKQVEKATAACDSAIKLSRRDAKRIKRSSPFGRASVQVADTGRAIALTNRGVLHALAGETAQARSKFEMAMELKSSEESAKANLAMLESKLAPSSS